MTRKAKNDSSDYFKFCLFFLCGSMAAYLVFEDRFIPLLEINNNYLWLLAGPFAIGLMYEVEFIALSFWLLLGLAGADIFMGFQQGVAEASRWSGVVVWFLTVPAGFAGFLFASLISGVKRRV